MLKLTAALLITASAAARAAAGEYDVVSSFTAIGSPFTFGSNFGANFAVSPNYVADGCLGTTGLACYNNPSADYTFPAAAKNISTSDPLTFYTNVLYKDMIFLQGLPGSTATVRFTAPSAGRYSFSSTFTRIDNKDGAGDGVDVGSTLGGAPSFLAQMYRASIGLDGTATLAAGSSVDFYVDSLSNTYNDGTGFALTVTAVPEPATWALFVGGFGLVGASLRRRVVGKEATSG